MVEATTQSLLKDSRAVVKIDCAEFQHSHEIAKLIGSPPGYLRRRETHPLLSQESLNQFHTDKLKMSFVLFDEVEKASDALWNLLLGILDKATLTPGANRRVDFSSAMIFLTSNLGAMEMSALANPRLGSIRPISTVTADGISSANASRAPASPPPAANSRRNSLTAWTRWPCSAHWDAWNCAKSSISNWIS
jgi:ATP-dependent Clp protease ATP-binding subunit ClpA